MRRRIWREMIEKGNKKEGGGRKKKFAGAPTIKKKNSEHLSKIINI